MEIFLNLGAWGKGSRNDSSLLKHNVYYLCNYVVYIYVYIFSCTIYIIYKHTYTYIDALYYDIQWIHHIFYSFLFLRR